MALTLPILLTVTASLIALLYNPLKLRAEVIGITRSLKPFQNIHGEDLRVIPNTVHCEDLHHHLPSGLLFAGCQGRAEERFFWFPPLGIFRDEKAAVRGDGGIFLIDTKTCASQRLTLEDFSDPLVTAGIDIYSSPSSPSTLHIFAVNYLPNPAYYSHPSPPPSTPIALSRIEIFLHTLGTTTATHIRSIQHPLIRTPNDIYATSPTTFYVTNDHHYRSGHMRMLEDLGFQALASWSDVIHINSSSTSDPINAIVAYSGLHNPNGLGHGRNETEILIVSTASGLLHHTSIDPNDPSGKKLRIEESVQLPSCIDNPSYYSDAYALSPGAPDDASGYVLAGLARAWNLPANHLNLDALDPVVVWFVQPGKEGERWSTRAIFQDDGKVIRTGSSAVLVGIDPQENQGRKQAWLFVTGFLSRGIVATKVDL